MYIHHETTCTRVSLNHCWSENNEFESLMKNKKRSRGSIDNDGQCKTYLDKVCVIGSLLCIEVEL